MAPVYTAVPFRVIGASRSAPYLGSLAVDNGMMGVVLLHS